MAVDFTRPWYRKTIVGKLCDGEHQHRKAWEFALMSEVIETMGKLGPGRRGLGFAVGQEPLASYFAKMGTNLTVTDMPPSNEAAKGWSQSNQWAGSVEATRKDCVCDKDTYHRRVSFEPLDMNHIPEKLLQGEYDFVWSSSSIEHVGSLELSKKVVVNAMKALKPGGIAVHTTEFALTWTGKSRHDVPGLSIWATDDVEDIERRVKAAGGRMFPMTYALGNTSVDFIVDTPPYNMRPHLKLTAPDEATAHTSILLIFQKDGGESIPFGPIAAVTPPPPPVVQATNTSTLP